MRAALRLVRATNVLVSFVGTIVGGLAAAAVGLALSGRLWEYLFLAAVSTAAVTAAGNVLNDLGDLEGDRTNHPDRPLVTGAIRVPVAQALTAGLFVLGIVVAVPVGLAERWLVPLLAAAVALLLGYEYLTKARGLLGNVSVAALTALVFLYGGASVGQPWMVAPFAAMAFFATLSREVIKDMEDVAGDVTRATVPKRWGMPAAASLARVSVAVAIALSVVPFLWYLSLSSLVGVAYAAVVAAADVVFVLSVRWLPDRLRLEQTVSKGAMTLALGAFLAVAFR